MPNKRIVIVGNQDGTNIGGSFYRAANRLGLNPLLVESKLAFQTSRLVNKFCWHFLGHLPPHLRKFSVHVVKSCRTFKPTWLLSTGIAPIDTAALSALKEMNIGLLNYSTDDPWNFTMSANWFFDALQKYDAVFSVRRSNLNNFLKLGLKNTKYLPFGYDPELFFPPTDPHSKFKPALSSDILFYGGADKSRLPYIKSLIHQRFKIILLGQYWDKISLTRPFARGTASPELLRDAISSTKIALCIVKKENRDGNCMKTFEIPAVGTCMLTEDTAEHRELFGEERNAVLYFRDPEELVSKVRILLENSELRLKLAQSAHRIIVEGKHTYQNRLTSILNY